MNTYNDVSTTSVMEGGILAGLLVVIGIVFLVLFVIWILTTIGLWKMFKKANEPGWKALIPIYNNFTLCKLVGVNVYWILILFIAGFLSGISDYFRPLSYIVGIYFNVLISFSAAKSYGKDESFGFLNLLVQPIGFMVLGLGNSKYIGAKPMKDIIFDSINKNSNNTGNSNINTNVAGNDASNNDVNSNIETLDSNDNDDNFGFCPSCGSKILEESAFCANCGQKL